MKRYLILLGFNVVGIIIAILIAVRNGDGGNTDPSAVFVGMPLIAFISVIWFVVITIRHRKTIFQNKWSVLPALIILVINIQELWVLYYLLQNRFS